MDNKCVEKLLETVAFSNGCICSVELIRWEHTHFHPSGDPEPSRHDIEVTKRLAEAGNLMGIEVLDHIVVAENRYFSFREENILPEYFQMEEVAAEQSLPYVKSEKEKVH